LDFGVVLQGYAGCAEDAAFAEQHGFSTAGFVESPLLAGDPFAWMALAAKSTETIRLGTMLMIPGVRSAAGAASGLAAVNRVAPGRVFFGIGSGYTSRQCLGLQQPVAASRMRDYANQVRDLLAGREVLQRVGNKEMSIRLKHSEALRVDPDQSVPIYIAADGPKALRAAGEAADGVIMTLQSVSERADRPRVFADALANVGAVAAENGRSFEDGYVVYSTQICILEPGESALSPRALKQIGPFAMVVFHAYACKPEIGQFLPPAVRDRLEIYEKEVLSRFDCPRERLYQEVHAGHLSHLLDGEAAVLTEDLIRMITVTGTAEEVATQLLAIERAGAHNVTFNIPQSVMREQIVEIEEQIMPLLRRTPADAQPARKMSASPCPPAPHSAATA
jgi:5,10-methylenetetrahydromethanopterin reductase